MFWSLYQPAMSWHESPDFFPTTVSLLIKILFLSSTLTEQTKQKRIGAECFKNQKRFFKGGVWRYGFCYRKALVTTRVLTWMWASPCRSAFQSISCLPCSFTGGISDKRFWKNRPYATLLEKVSEDPRGQRDNLEASGSWSQTRQKKSLLSWGKYLEGSFPSRC